MPFTRRDCFQEHQIDHPLSPGPPYPDTLCVGRIEKIATETRPTFLCSHQSRGRYRSSTRHYFRTSPPVRGIFTSPPSRIPSTFFRLFLLSVVEYSFLFNQTLPTQIHRCGHTPFHLTRSSVNIKFSFRLSHFSIFPGCYWVVPWDYNFTVTKTSTRRT